MRAIVRRLRRLEARLGPSMASWQVTRLQERLEAAGRRCGLPPSSPERLAELRNRSVAEILAAGRQRARMKLARPSWASNRTEGNQ
jgi:hypothetical protein